MLGTLAGVGESRRSAAVQVTRKRNVTEADCDSRSKKKVRRVHTAPVVGDARVRLGPSWVGVWFKIKYWEETCCVSVCVCVYVSTTSTHEKYMGTRV